MLHGHLAVDSTSGSVTPSGTLTSNSIIIGQGTSVVAASDTFLLEGTGQTVGNVTADLITIALGASPAGYRMESFVIGFESTTPASPCYSLRGGSKTDGAAASVTGTPTKEGEMDSLTEVDVDFVASSGNIIVRVTGETGLTINWRASLRYVSVS